MGKKITRREFLKITGATGTVLLLGSCSPDKTDQSFFDRLTGKPRTQLPIIEQAWSFAGGELFLDLDRLPEIESMGSGVRIEGDALPEPVLVVLGDDGNYYSFLNACTHAGRMIDPVTGSMTLECCSISKSTFDYDGKVLSGPASEELTSFPLRVDENQLIIELGV